MDSINNNQAAFIEAMDSLKEFATVNGGFVTTEDIRGYFKDMTLDDGQMQMIYGYLMANNIKVKGQNVKFDMSFASDAAKDDNEHAENEEEREFLTQQINAGLNYDEDDKYLTLYREDLAGIEKLSDKTRAMLLVNIAEDNDAQSLQLLTQSMLEDVISYVEPFRKQGILASDLVQEGNLAMLAYMKEKRFLHNYEWKEKLKEGSIDDAIGVLDGIKKDIKDEVVGSIKMMIDEQLDSAKVSQKVLNKVNLINDWAKRLKEELGRKPYIEEVAEKSGVAKEDILEAIQLSAEAIEDIEIKK